MLRDNFLEVLDSECRDVPIWEIPISTLQHPTTIEACSRRYTSAFKVNNFLIYIHKIATGDKYMYRIYTNRWAPKWVLAKWPVLKYMLWSFS